VGVKRLTGADTTRSNQHEVGTTREMRAQFLGDQEQKTFQTFYIWLDDDNTRVTAQGRATHYDTRENASNRSPEWRLYYDSNPVTEAMREGDLLFLAHATDGLLYFVVARRGSTIERQLLWLFDISPDGERFVSREIAESDRELDFSVRFILSEIGIEIEDVEADNLDSIVGHLDEFPSTYDFSKLARQTLAEVNALADPDAALVAWLSHEESLFRRLERRIVASRLEEGFRKDDGFTDVDGFIRFSLSVQNRRKSRMGLSLEHHLEAVFGAHNIAHVRDAVTENNQRPDFLFPGADAYQAAPGSGSASLMMLAAKSSCKERWRQVLAEASKIPNKHLLTLEPGISEPQTDQMQKSALQLVVPESIQVSFTRTQRAWLWTLRDFIEEARRRATKVSN